MSSPIQDAPAPQQPHECSNGRLGAACCGRCTAALSAPLREQDNARGQAGEVRVKIEENKRDSAGSPAARQPMVVKPLKPRERRALAELLERELTREQLDGVAGASNGPAVIMGLRRRGLDIPCRMEPVLDRDDEPIRRGIYHLTDEDKKIACHLVSGGSA